MKLVTLFVMIEIVWCHYRVSQNYPKHNFSPPQRQTFFPQNVQGSNNRNQYFRSQNSFNNKIQWKKKVLSSAVQWKKNFLQEKSKIVNDLLQPKIRFKQNIIKVKYNLKRKLWNAKRRLFKPLFDIKRKKISFLKELVDHKINFIRSLFGWKLINEKSFHRFVKVKEPACRCFFF